jgi:hypothetical protein
LKVLCHLWQCLHPHPPHNPQGLLAFPPLALLYQLQVSLSIKLP